MDPLLGTIILWPVPFVPVGFALCDGSTIPINQNQALFALIGTNYGGDGVSTFKLPDLRNKMPLGLPQVNAQPAPNGGGSNTISLTAVGTGAITLTPANLPAHTHTFSSTGGGTVSIAIPVNTGGGTNTDTPGPTTVLSKGTVVGGPVNTTSKQYTTAAANATLLPFDAPFTGSGSSGTTGSTGAGTAIPIGISVPISTTYTPPYCQVNFIIAMQGMFPSRN